MSRSVTATQSALEVLKALGVEAKGKKVIGIYGPSMVGKSVFAAMIARDFVGGGGAAVVYGTEEHYGDEDYRQLIAGLLPGKHYINYCPDIPSLFRYMNMVKGRRFEGRLALILDSLSTVVLKETASWEASGVTEPRVIVARTIPTANAIAAYFKHLVVGKDALGIVIMHAASTAGSGKYRGLTDLRPSMAMRTAHSLDYLLQITAAGARPGDPRTLTLVASRLTPLNEGRSVEFVFKDKNAALVGGDAR